MPHVRSLVYEWSGAVTRTSSVQSGGHVAPGWSGKLDALNPQRGDSSSVDVRKEVVRCLQPFIVRCLQ